MMRNRVSKVTFSFVGLALLAFLPRTVSATAVPPQWGTGACSSVSDISAPGVPTDTICDPPSFATDLNALAPFPLSTASVNAFGASAMATADLTAADHTNRILGRLGVAATTTTSSDANAGAVFLDQIRLIPTAPTNSLFARVSIAASATGTVTGDSLFDLELLGVSPVTGVFFVSGTRVCMDGIPTFGCALGSGTISSSEVVTVDLSDPFISFGVDASLLTNPGGSGNFSDPIVVSIGLPAGFDYTTASATALSQVPEPSSLLLLSSGLACLGAWRRKMLRRI